MINGPYRQLLMNDINALHTMNNGPSQKCAMINGPYRQYTMLNDINALRTTKNCPNEKRVMYHNEWSK